MRTEPGLRKDKEDGKHPDRDRHQHRQTDREASRQTGRQRATVAERNSERRAGMHRMGQGVGRIRDLTGQVREQE